MALIEYDIHYKNGKSHVAYKVVEVDPGDRISFKSRSAAQALPNPTRSSK
jgi:hypothetical protein